MKTNIILLLIFFLYFILAIFGKRKLIKDYIQPLFIGFVLLCSSYIFFADNVNFQKWFHNPLSVQAIYIYCSLGMFCGGIFYLYIVFERTKVYIDSKKNNKRSEAAETKPSLLYRLNLCSVFV
jgi:hypothetical protein